jgi:hypothetical protein
MNGGLLEVERGARLLRPPGGVTALLITEPQPWRQGVWQTPLARGARSGASLHTSYMRQDLNFYDSFALGDDKTRVFCSLIMHAC